MSESEKILMVFPFVPYPLRANGVSVRYLPVIKHLAKKHVLDIIIITDEINDINWVKGLEEYCRKLIIIKKQNKIEKYKFIIKVRTHLNSYLPWTAPITYVGYNDNDVTRQIVENVKGTYYNSVVWVTCNSSTYLFPAMEKIDAKRVVMDFIDSPALLAIRQMNRSSPLNIFKKYEVWKIKMWEAKIIKKVTASAYISPVDATIIPEKAAFGCPRHIIYNGINVDSYSASVKKGLPSPSIGFLGHMNYPPNIEAAHWLYDEIFDPLRRKIPNLSLIIIGRSPAPSIVQLGRKQGVFVTGTVDEIWPYVNAVDVFVFPIWIGGGIKNKVLETMYAKKPVLTTDIGNEGIKGISNHHLIICNKKQEFYDNLNVLLNSEKECKRLGNEAFDFVIEKFSWDGLLNNFESLIIG